MNLLENYNTASQKYSIELVKQLTELGLPPQYLLSACRFVKENSIPLSNMINQFKEWTKFVTKYNKYDVNRLSYDDFLRIISQEKSKHIIPNLIWQNEIAFLGKLNNAKDVQTIPVKNQWCIKSQNWFDRYTDKGYVFFVIYLPNEPLPFTFVVVAVCGGNVEYYDTQDYEQFEDLRGGNENNSDHEVYQRKLPNEIVSYLYDIAASQTEAMENRIKTENNEYKINKNMKKQVIRLTEGDLHRIIKESVNNILSELDWKTYANAEKKMRGERGDADYWRNKGVKGFDAIRKAANARELAKRLGDAAKQSFDRDYGYQQGEHFYDDDYQRVGMGGDFNSTEEFAPHAAGWRHDGVASLKRFPHGVYTTERTPEDFFKGNLDAVQAYNKAKDEVETYKKGNYEYQNGKGWTKK